MLNDTIGCSLQKDTQYDFFNNTRQEDAKGSPRGGGAHPAGAGRPRDPSQAHWRPRAALALRTLLVTPDIGGSGSSLHDDSTVTTLRKSILSFRDAESI